MIAFDIDGVVCDTDSLIQKEIYNNYGLPVLIDKNGWFHLENKSDEETDQIIKNIIHTKIHLADPFPSAFSILEFFHHMLDGYPLTFLSARSPCTQKITEEWFKRHFDKDIKFIVKCMGTHNKVPPVMELTNKFNKMYFVEDTPAVAMSLRDNIPDLSGVYLINNLRRATGLKLGRKIIKCKNLTDVFEKYVNSKG